MAFDNAVIDKTTLGHKRCHVISMVADANSGTVVTGLSVIDHIQATPVSCTTFSRMKFKRNLDSDGSTTANGTIFVSSATNGDVVTIYAVGK